MAKRILQLLLCGSLFLTTGCAELKVLRDRVALQDKEIARLRKENADFQKAYYQISQDRTVDASSRQGQIEDLNRALEQAQTQRTEKEKALEEQLHKKTLAAQAMEDQLGEKLAQSSQKILTLTDAAAKAELARQDVQERHDALTLERARDQEKIEKLESELASMKKAAQDLAEKLDREEKARAAVESDLNDSRKKLDTAQSSLKKLEGEKSAAEKEAESAKGQARKLNEEMAALKKAPRAPSLEEDEDLKRGVKEMGERLSKLPAAKSVSVRLDSRGLRIIIPSDAAFNPGSVLLSDEMKPVLKSLAEGCKTLPERAVRIEGHTDNQPVTDLPFADNWGLGSARADRVRQYMTDEGGLESDRVEVLSRGSSDPLTDNKTPEARAKNRRVEIVIGAARPRAK